MLNWDSKGILEIH